MENITEIVDFTQGKPFRKYFEAQNIKHQLGLEFAVQPSHFLFFLESNNKTLSNWHIYVGDQLTNITERRQDSSWCNT